MERRVLSIGLADLTGWQQAIAGQPLEAVGNLLEEAYGRAGDAIVDNGARVHKYMGDAVMFVADSAASAVAAAHAIAATGPFRIGDRDLRFRVGVASGEVITGEFGHSSLRRWDLFGDVVNRTVDLLAEAKVSPSQVAIAS
ncbi:MAG: hypothetical protein JOZ39_02395 [Chloroflexi bacterium]|nr:hypothetical protein [Chloroflexota bacterium]